MFLSVISLLTILLSDKIYFYWMFYAMLMFLLMFNKSVFNCLVYMDELSFYMLLMTLWVYFLSMDYKMKKYNSIIFLMMFYCNLQSFYTNYLLLFYIMFEVVFLMMFIFLMNNSNTMERIQASLYMFFYTLVFSLPFLVMVLMMMYMNTDSMIYINLMMMHSTFLMNYLWFFMVLILMVKLPIFSLHLWLPKAHVEASLKGSMILAGVLLKIGGYGFLRLFPLLLMKFLYKSNFLMLMMMLSLLGGGLVSFWCLRQTDLKKMIAYSSIVHMNFMMVGFWMNSLLSTKGVLLMMLSHGFISPLMFYLMNQYYTMNHSRSLIKIKSGLMVNPILSILWLTSCVLNFSFPPFMSFISEVMIFMTMTTMSFKEFFIMMMFPFMSAIYSMFMYMLLIQRNFQNSLKITSKMKVFVDFLMMTSLVIFYPLFLF